MEEAFLLSLGIDVLMDGNSTWTSEHGSKGREGATECVLIVEVHWVVGVGLVSH